MNHERKAMLERRRHYLLTKGDKLTEGEREWLAHIENELTS